MDDDKSVDLSEEEGTSSPSKCFFDLSKRKTLTKLQTPSHLSDNLKSRLETLQEIYT